ncbi:MAG: hypothetical protein MZV49_04915 [Rhodopseudomonas palustris]|nr:hypothetical protein [Rhodopseudomonas palustris]
MYFAQGYSATASRPGTLAGQLDGGGHCRHGRAFRRLCPPAAPVLSRWHTPALAGQVLGMLRFALRDRL